jgi:hypothetical protein
MLSADEWRWALGGEERRRRPAHPKRLTFAGLADGGRVGRASALVPIDALRSGDEQAFVAVARRGEPSVDTDLVRFAGYPMLRSVVASGPVRASGSVPQLREAAVGWHQSEAASGRGDAPQPSES